MKLFVSAIILFFSFSAPLHSGAQQINPKTLLWRISGNGLQNPSYLYGTMHLKDRRLFFFGDSVYKSLETSDGFAMEIDPNEMMDSIFSKIGEADTTSLLRKILDKEKFKSVSKKLEKKFHIPAEKISRKQLIAERESWYNNIHKNDDMKGVVDMYLYDIAHRQGKWVGGIEDVSDQLGIFDELGKEININEYLDDDNNDEKRKHYLEEMVSTYTTEDIGRIDQMVSGSQSQRTIDLLLINRNGKMAARMDSLAHIRNSFFAIGAAHLAGEKGVIHLLQSRGFSVSPVFSSKKIDPDKYTYTKKEIPWIKFLEQDSAYSVEMPGKAADLKLPSEEVKFKVYADLATNTVYMSGYSFISTNENQEDLVNRMVKSFLDKGFEKNAEKKINNRGNNGTEISASTDKLHYRMQIFPFSDKVFMILAGAEQKESIYNADAERFLTSFTMSRDITARPNQWQEFTDTVKGFDVTFPKKPAVDKLKASETAKNIETTTYTAVDVSAGTYYLVVISETKKGFMMSDDSIVFDAKLKYYKQIKSKISDIRKFDFAGNAAMSFTAQSLSEGLEYTTKMLIICRGNRSYTVFVVAQKGKEDFPDITRFFRSFKLAPYQQSKWEKMDAANNVFSTWAPSSFEQLKPDTAGLSAEEIKNELYQPQKFIQFIAQEKNSVINYNVDVYPMSKYYWAANDSIYLEDQLKSYFSDTASLYAKSNPGRFDSLIYRKIITNGNVKGKEILIKNAAKAYYKRVRILPHGDSSYHIFILGPYNFITNENNNKFFEDFRFTDEALPSNILKNKTALLMNDLGSKDSATRTDAAGFMRDVKFERSDLSVLQQAYLKKYPADTFAYYTTNDRINEAIIGLADSSTIAFVRDNYISGTKRLPELKTGMIQMLASLKTKAAMQVAKELLLKAPPEKGPVNSLINALCDSLSLSAGLFPEVSRFFEDSVLGPGMLKLAVELINSNKLSKDIVLQNQERVIRLSNSQLVQIKKQAYAAYNSYIIDALKIINTKQAIAMLNNFVKVPDLSVKENALLALLKLKQTISPVDVRKLAASNAYRTGFYKELKEIGKQPLFPPEFLTQAQFAESYIFNDASGEDADNVICKLIAEKVGTIHGLQQRFYIFKLLLKFQDATESYLGICGGFSMDKKIVDLKDGELRVKIFYGEKYLPASANYLYESFVEEQNTATESKQK